MNISLIVIKDCPRMYRCALTEKLYCLPLKYVIDYDQRHCINRAIICSAMCKHSRAFAISEPMGPKYFWTCI